MLSRWKAQFTGIVRGTNVKWLLTIVVSMSLALGVALVIWDPFPRASTFIGQIYGMAERSISSYLGIFTVTGDWVLLFLLGLALVIAVLGTQLIRHLRPLTSHNDRAQITTKYAFLITGVPTLSFGLLYYIDGALTPLVTPSVPFPGWDVLLLLIGLVLTLHGLLWRSMTRWKKLYTAIDYVWYGGGVVVLALISTQYYSSSEISLFRSIPVEYHVAKKIALGDLTPLLQQCLNPKLIEKSSEYAETDHNQPSQRLCLDALESSLRWVGEKLISLNETFQYELLDPNFRHQTGDLQIETDFTLAWMKFKNSRTWTDQSTFCKLAEEEWSASGWERIEAKMLDPAIGSQTLPSARLDQFNRQIRGPGTRGFNLEFHSSLMAPHRFGSDSCGQWDKIATKLEFLAGRTFFTIPAWIQWLVSKWPVFLSMLIAVRLLRTTIEFRRHWS